MEKIVPNKLQVGDKIRIIAPSRSLKIIDNKIVDYAINRLKSAGFQVSFGKNVMKYESKNFKCASICDRIEDLHEAFQDKNVKAILSVIGGYNVNQLLDYIDYDLIQNNPKIICGFSDITALTNSIYAKTGLVTYSGPHFSSFGIKKGFDYTEKYFKKMFMQSEKISIEASAEWSNDNWFKNQENREFTKNEGMKILNPGVAKGKIIGGNLCTLNLLQGTEYMPDLQNSVLFIEDDGETGKHFNKEFDRNLQSLLHSAKDKKINGLVIGRAEKVSEMNFDKWKEIIQTKQELKDIPIVIDADFGHTAPIFTFPIGGDANIIANDKEIKIEIYD